MPLCRTSVRGLSEQQSEIELLLLLLLLPVWPSSLPPFDFRVDECDLQQHPVPVPLWGTDSCQRITQHEHRLFELGTYTPRWTEWTTGVDRSYLRFAPRSAQKSSFQCA